jgi:hypothetical protein
MAEQLQEVELEQQALTWPQKAKAIIIADRDSYNQGAGLLINIADLKKEIIDHHKESKEKAFAAHKAIVAAEKRMLDPLVEAETIIKRSLGVFIQEQERIRIEAERKAQDKARKREEEARLALAIEAEKQGATAETIQEIVDTPMPMQISAILPSFASAPGISSGRKPVYRWRVVNEALVPREYLALNEVKINGVVRAMGATAKIAGIEVYEDIPNIAIRARR